MTTTHKIFFFIIIIEDLSELEKEFLNRYHHNTLIIKHIYKILTRLL